jgi:NTP pyrophosphatase (non-canonical NTP hydrolase)
MSETVATKPTLGDLQAEVNAFAAERGWERFHAPKNLAMSVAIEAAELMEHFQWTELQTLIPPNEKQAIGEEMADVLAYLLRLASVLEIDLAHAFRLKMAKNALKYPVESDLH